MSNSLRTLRRRALRTRGFTLLEIMVVLAIIGLLVGLAVNRIGKALENAQEDVARAFVKSSMTAPLMSYRIDMGGFPSTAEGLTALFTMPQNSTGRWRGPYAEGNSVPLDPWKQPYQYAFPGKHNPKGYDLWSKGPDGQDGTGDEIGNWENPTEGATGK